MGCRRIGHLLLVSTAGRRSANDADAATGTGTGTGTGTSVATRQRMSMRAGRWRADTAAIREWASANGLVVSARGRISSVVLEAYENRGNASAAAAVAKAPAAAFVAESAVEAVVEAEAKPKRRTRKKATAES